MATGNATECSSICCRRQTLSVTTLASQWNAADYARVSAVKEALSKRAIIARAFTEQELVDHAIPYSPRFSLGTFER